MKEQNLVTMILFPIIPQKINFLEYFVQTHQDTLKGCRVVGRNKITIQHKVLLRKTGVAI
jgi:hypothetical protein